MTDPVPYPSVDWIPKFDGNDATYYAYARRNLSRLREVTRDDLLRFLTPEGLKLFSEDEAFSRCFRNGSATTDSVTLVAALDRFANFANQNRKSDLTRYLVYIGRVIDDIILCLGRKDPDEFLRRLYLLDCWLGELSDIPWLSPQAEIVCSIFSQEVMYSHRRFHCAVFHVGHWEYLKQQINAAHGHYLAHIATPAGVPVPAFELAIPPGRDKPGIAVIINCYSKAQAPDLWETVEELTKYLRTNLWGVDEVQNPTVENVTLALKKVKEQAIASPNNPEQILLFYIGHGSIKGQIRLSDGGYLELTPELFLDMDPLRAKNIHALVLLHCCHSMSIAGNTPQQQPKMVRVKSSPDLGGDPLKAKWVVAKLRAESAENSVSQIVRDSRFVGLWHKPSFQLIGCADPGLFSNDVKERCMPALFLQAIKNLLVRKSAEDRSFAIADELAIEMRHLSKLPISLQSLRSANVEPGGMFFWLDSRIIGYHTDDPEKAKAAIAQENLVNDAADNPVENLTEFATLDAKRTGARVAPAIIIPPMNAAEEASSAAKPAH